MITKLPDAWQKLWKDLGFTTFTPIQEQLFDPISQGDNTLGISPTGTGKTLAYLLPLLLRIRPKKAQQLLILSPNTELAGQLFEVTKTWAEPLGLSAQLFLSGSSQKRQIERLKKGPEIVIGTPGRIFELIKLKKIKMMSVDTVVLDEYDELLNDSQLQFVERITHYVPRNHQLIYISATATVASSDLAPDTKIIDCSTQQIDTIHHYYILVDKRHRTDLLRKFSNIPDFRGLVFFNSLSDLGAVEERLQFEGSSASSLASDVNVKQRKLILEKFKNHDLSLLLGTDLIARGIDIDQLETVINFEVPRDKDIYTHRSGRTGRMGKEGAVITFISHPEDLKKLKKFASVQEVFLKDQNLFVR